MIDDLRRMRDEAQVLIDASNRIRVLPKAISSPSLNSLYDPIVAATGALLYRHTRQESFALSTSISGRARNVCISSRRGWRYLAQVRRR